MIVGEHGGLRSEEDGAVKLSDSDLWKETRLGAPTAGGVWDRVQGQRTRGGGELGQDSEAGEGGGGHKVIERKGVERMKRTMTWPQTWEATHRRWARRWRETE